MNPLARQRFLSRVDHSTCSSDLPVVPFDHSLPLGRVASHLVVAILVVVSHSPPHSSLFLDSTRNAAQRRRTGIHSEQSGELQGPRPKAQPLPPSLATLTCLCSLDLVFTPLLSCAPALRPSPLLSATSRPRQPCSTSPHHCSLRPPHTPTATHSPRTRGSRSHLSIYSNLAHCIARIPFPVPTRNST